MSLIPAFEAGVWNAWIFMAYLMLSFIPFFIIAVRKKTPSVDDTTLSVITRMLASSSKLLLLPVLVYSIFLPLQTGSFWFYAGLPITLAGLAGYTVVLVNWAVAPVDKPVFGGLYRFSRHPMYVTMFIFFLGLGILSASWVLLLFFVIFTVGCVIFAGDEEQSCLDKWGNEYRDYVNRTPRWLGLPKPPA